MNRQVAISGYYGFGNAGDEAVLSGIARSFAEGCPTAHLVVQSIDPQGTRDMHGLDAVNRYSLVDVFETIKDSDILISGGGSLLQDVTSGRSVLYYLAVIAMAKMLRTKVMIYAQGIGPLNSKPLRSLCKTILNKVDLITVRDEQSERTLKDLGVTRPRTIVTADASFAVEPVERDEVSELLTRAGIMEDRKMLGVSLRPWEDHTHWMPEVASALRKAESDLGLLPVFVPMQKSMDLSITLSAADAASSSPAVIAEQLSPAQAKGIASAMDLVVSMRLHNLIFAASAGVPFVALSYDPKVEEFARIAGQPVIDVKSVTSSALYGVISEVYENREKMSETIRERIEPIKALAVRNAELACELIGINSRSQEQSK